MLSDLAELYPEDFTPIEQLELVNTFNTYRKHSSEDVRIRAYELIPLLLDNQLEFDKWLKDEPYGDVNTLICNEELDYRISLSGD